MSIHDDIVRAGRLRQELAQTEGRIRSAQERATQRPLSDDELHARTEIQARADSAYALHGRQAPPPLYEEMPQAYQRRALNGLREHSDTWKNVDLRTVTADVVALIEPDILRESEAAARSPKNVPAGQVREVRSQDKSGRVISEFYGDPEAWMRDFKAPARVVTSWDAPENLYRSR